MYLQHTFWHMIKKLFLEKLLPQWLWLREVFSGYNSLFHVQIILCRYSLESPHQGNSNVPTFLTLVEKYIKAIYSFSVNTINIVIECNENISIFTSATHK